MQGIENRGDDQPGEGEGQQAEAERLRQLTDGSVRPHGDQQVEAKHRRRQDQRQCNDGTDRSLENGAGARQPPSDRRTDDEQQQRDDRGQFQGQPDGSEIGTIHAGQGRVKNPGSLHRVGAIPKHLASPTGRPAYIPGGGENQFHVNLLTDVFSGLGETDAKPIGKPDHASHLLQDVTPAAC